VGRGFRREISGIDDDTIGAAEEPLRNQDKSVKLRPNPATVLLLLLAATCLGQTPGSPPAQTAPQPAPGPLNRSVIVLDAAHGGVDGGSRIGDSTLEKDVTLALAFRLRSLLAARGFTVVMTRENDAALRPGAPGTALTLDDRAGIANHARAAACLLLHATGAGQGVHLYSSELDAAPAEAAVLPWLTAQAAWVAQSALLEAGLGAALKRAGVPLVSSRASVRPVDSMTCPAIVVELAPEDDDRAGINDTDYQQRVAEAIAGALVFWSRQVQPPPRLPSERAAAAGAQP
jgi:N-acetylmuramoyl-L-alanine amidase